MARWRGRNMGIVFQFYQLLPMLSLLENTMLPMDLCDMYPREEREERALALLDRVGLRSDAHKMPGAVSGGQQQRLCIARTLAMKPDVILFDEPCSALDPIATLRIEDLMRSLAENYTIVIVTHNMQQAARASDMSAFFMMDDNRTGLLVEYGPTAEIFTNPKDKRTEDYITGRFG